MLEAIIVVLLVLWLLGYFGRGRIALPAPPELTARWGGNWIHILLVIVVILVIVRLLD